MLSKRTAKISEILVDRIEATIKQLKFNDKLHPKHEHKLKNKDKDKLPARTKRYLQNVEQEINLIDRSNTKLRKNLQENLEEKKELKYHLDKLKEAWDVFQGKHPLQKDLEKVLEENKTYE